LTMTQQVMSQFGIRSSIQLDQSPCLFTIEPKQRYQSCGFHIEPDATAASYFWAVAAICGGRATIAGLNQHSLQGDLQFLACLERMGCRVIWSDREITVEGKAVCGIDVDMSNFSDTVQRLAVVAMFVDSPTTITGVAHNRVKETDRIGNLAIELRKLGAVVEERTDGLMIRPDTIRPAKIETYNDHRMAMALSLAGLRQSGVVIDHPECTRKTYPHFFADLDSVTRN